jgi:hypothetical protein
MIRRSPLLLAFAILVGACQGLTEPDLAELGEPFWLRHGRSVVIPTTTGTLRFTEILEEPASVAIGGFVVRLLDIAPAATVADPTKDPEFHPRLVITAVR